MAFGFGRRRGLRQWVLLILSRDPKNGAEIMDAMESMSQGWWRPSPGSVYPLLEDLVHDGFIRRKDDGRYEMTSRGREETSWAGGWFGGSHARAPKEVLDELANYTAYLEDLASSAKGALVEERDRLKKIAQRLHDLAG